MNTHEFTPRLPASPATEDRATAEVKSCPFCGEAPNVAHGSWTTSVRCSNKTCECSGVSFLIALWNTRTVDPLITQLGEALGRIIAELPHNKDWLDPVLESQARAALTKYQEVKP